MFAITYKKIWLSLTAAIMLGSVALIAGLGLNLGIDFTGGSLTEIAYEDRPAAATLENALTPLNLGEVSLRPTSVAGEQPGYILRTRDLSETERQQVEEILTTSGGEVVRFTSIGPVIGEELKDKAVWAIAAVVVIIILYVSIAFAGVSYPVGSWVYGGITILALIHDVLIPTAVMSVLGVLLGVEIDVLFVMAVLAVLGYSVNDTIVVFDRVRENLKRYRIEQKTTETVAGGLTEERTTYTLQKPFSEIVGLSVSQTLFRSINTSVTTLLPLGALYFIGGDVTKTFTLALIAGVVAGTYSSIFFANPLLALVAERKGVDSDVSTT